MEQTGDYINASVEFYWLHRQKQPGEESGALRQVVENNIAEQGGAIRSQATDGTIANCIIRNNTATTNGSGIYTQTATTSATKIINCLIYGNRTKVAIYMYGADIINCTVDGGDVNSVYVTTAGGKIINSVFTSDIQSDLATGVEFTNNAYAAIKGNDGWTNSNNLEITDGNFGFTDCKGRGVAIRYF